MKIFKISNGLEQNFVNEVRKNIQEYKQGVYPVCATCQTVRLSTDEHDPNQKWITQEEFNINVLPLFSPEEQQVLSMSHTYCPSCYEKLMDQINQM